MRADSCGAWKPMEFSALTKSRYHWALRCSARGDKCVSASQSRTRGARCSLNQLTQACSLQRSVTAHMPFVRSSLEDGSQTPRSVGFGVGIAATPHTHSWWSEQAVGWSIDQCHHHQQQRHSPQPHIGVCRVSCRLDEKTQCDVMCASDVSHSASWPRVVWLGG